MRNIDIEDVRKNLPEGWEGKADKALDEIRNVPPEKRIQMINERAEIWQELKPYLDSISDGKCWYCESRQYRSDNAVDHFRPKGRVIECPESTHYGYWWLAFNWTNYRFSCTFCNSRRRDRITGTCGGKQNHFPLIDEKFRAKDEASNLEMEHPYLLDPTHEADPGLLSFNELGEAIPKFNDPIQPFNRAKKSIDLYNLNFHKTKKRRSARYDYIKRLILDNDRYFKRYISDNPDPDVDHAFKQNLKGLKKLISKKAEFSAAARVYIKSFQGEKREWLDIIFQTF